MTKRELLAQIRRGPTSAAAEPSIGSDTQAITFRVALAGNAANRGVRISLTPALTYAIKRDAAAFAFDGQEQTPLTRKEAGTIAAYISGTMKMREHPRLR
jgi:hypothetical protein